jgi:hypothetical protein
MMMKILRIQRVLLTGVSGVVACLLLAQTVSAATVYNCSDSGMRCVAKLEVGSVGDQVKVLDEKAREVAKGRIVKRRGTYAILALTEVNKTIRKGYPVIVNVDSKSSAFEWAANFSNRD